MKRELFPTNEMDIKFNKVIVSHNKVNVILRSTTSLLPERNSKKESKYSKTCLKRPLIKQTKIGLQDMLLLNAGQ